MRIGGPVTEPQGVTQRGLLVGERGQIRVQAAQPGGHDSRGMMGDEVAQSRGCSGPGEEPGAVQWMEPHPSHDWRVPDIVEDR